MTMSKTARWVSLLLIGGLLPACAPTADSGTAAVPAAFACDADDGGLVLPQGFCATVFADDLGATRHLVVDEEGDVYASRIPRARRTADGGREVQNAGGLIALRDSDGDGKADIREEVSDVPGTGVALHGGYLYFTSDTEVFRVALNAGELAPSATPESIVSGFPSQSQHAAKTITLDDAGGLYVNVGGPSNACQETTRTPGSPGLDPCPQREWQASIWRFDASTPGQTQEDGVQYARGIRNAVALDWNRPANVLYAMQHGRDSLGQLWPDLYDDEQSAELPAEEMLHVDEGDDFGWPYCYYDPEQAAMVLAPEYGGDGQQVGRCADVEGPVAAFPAHWAPDDLVFYDSDAFPARYAGGAFIAFHGSWNRMPLPQQGYSVVFVPFAGGRPSGDYEVFASGFTQTQSVRTPGDAAHRPTGLAVGPDGSLYVADDSQGRIWRIRFARAPNG